MSEIRQDHRGNRLLASLPPEIFASVTRDLREVSLTQGSMLYEAGQEIEEIYFPQTGLISLLVPSRDGGAVETGIVGREGALGMQRGLGPRQSFTRATTQISGRFSLMRASRFADHVRAHAPLRDMIQKYTELLLAESQQISACNAVHDAASRLCRWLLQASERIGSEKVPLTQEFRAQMLGVRRTTVTLLAQSLQTEGFIKYGRGQITILERKRLSERACECYHVLQHDKLPLAIGVKF